VKAGMNRLAANPLFTEFEFDFEFEFE